MDKMVERLLGTWGSIVPRAAREGRVAAGRCCFVRLGVSLRNESATGERGRAKCKGDREIRRERGLGGGVGGGGRTYLWVALVI